MKILKYILIMVVLLTLYITEPMWRVHKTTEVSQIDAQMKKQQDARNNLTAKEAEELRKLEEKFGKKPDLAYKSRVPKPLQEYWDRTLKKGEFIYDDICYGLTISNKGWTTTCQYQIKNKNGSSSGLKLNTFVIKDGVVVK